MNKNNNEEIDLNSLFDKHVPIVSKQSEDMADSFVTTVYLTNEIDKPNVYSELLEVLAAAKPVDEITFIINSPGGYIDTTIMLIDAILECKAYTVMKVAGEAASAATMLALAGDELVITDFSSMMIHNYSAYSAGKGHEVVAKTTFESKALAKLFRKAYKPFLSEEECQQVIDGKDIYLDASEVRARWELCLRKREKQQEKFMKKQEKLNKEHNKKILKELADAYGYSLVVSEEADA